MSNSTYFIDGYPYSDTHNLNLDWVINKLKQIETEMGEITDGLEIHVKDDTGTEVYVFTVKGNGIYVTRPDGGTPIYYNLASGQLHAPTFDGQSILTATGRTTGQFQAGSLVLDNPLPITGGGTGATTATEARTALGAEAAFDVLGIPKGGTGASTAEEARTNLGAMASDAVIPITQGGTGATTAANARTALGAMASNAVIPITQGGTGATTLRAMQDVIGIYSQTENAMSFNFPNLPNITNAAYKYGIIYGGDASTAFCYLMWVNVNNTTFSFFPMAQATSARTLTGSYANGTVTITANATIYGGLRLIWFNS